MTKPGQICQDCGEEIDEYGYCYCDTIDDYDDDNDFFDDQYCNYDDGYCF